ncbi:MAG: hypothetical protein KU37_03025 [Sulfuricurvum sp. PC08-66]|nr:MAG: hypothetical protein KU37_03025 [Sulfuricurvum sp. PC08-66]
MTDFFARYDAIILFLHVLSAIVWVGGMIAIRFAVHPALQHIEDATVRLARTLEILKNFFALVIPMIVLLIVTAVLMSMGLGFKNIGGFLYGMVHFKEAIWTIMTIIFIFIYIRRNRAQRAFLAGDLATTKALLAPIAKIFIPVNIFLGLVALFVGGILRGF